MKSISAATLLFSLVLAGCGSNQAIPEQQPTISFSCESSCSLEFRDPRDQPKMPTNGYDVANTLIGTVGSVAISAAPWLAVGAIATKGITHAGSVDSSTRTDSTHTPTVVNQPAPVVVNQPAPLIFPAP